MEIAFKVKQKVFFTSFKELSVAKICFGPEIVPSTWQDLFMCLGSIDKKLLSRLEDFDH